VKSIRRGRALTNPPTYAETKKWSL